MWQTPPTTITAPVQTLVKGQYFVEVLVSQANKRDFVGPR
jgi:hypothetical protein